MNCLFFYHFVKEKIKRVNNTIIKVVCKVTLEATYNKNKTKWVSSLFYFCQKYLIFFCQKYLIFLSNANFESNIMIQMRLMGN